MLLTNLAGCHAVCGLHVNGSYLDIFSHTEQHRLLSMESMRNAHARLRLRKNAAAGRKFRLGVSRGGACAIVGLTLPSRHAMATPRLFPCTLAPTPHPPPPLPLTTPTAFTQKHFLPTHATVGCGRTHTLPHACGMQTHRMGTGWGRVCGAAQEWPPLFRASWCDGHRMTAPHTFRFRCLAATQHSHRRQAHRAFRARTLLARVGAAAALPHLAHTHPHLHLPPVSGMQVERTKLRGGLLPYATAPLPL